MFDIAQISENDANDIIFFLTNLIEYKLHIQVSDVGSGKPLVI